MPKNVYVVVFFLSLFFAMALPVSAHPPQNIELSYDLKAHALNVAMDHISDDKRAHYIRKIDVYINGEETKTEHNRLQVDPVKFEMHIDVEAKAGDVIMIKAYCREGGTAEASLTVENPEMKEKEKMSMPAKPEESAGK